MANHEPTISNELADLPLADVPLSVLFAVLVLLILFSAFFSATETSMMAINRYKLKHSSKSQRSAKRVSSLLKRPDRLIGVILLGNNFVNLMAASITTVIAARLLGASGLAIATGILTAVILIFAEVAPKTLAALHPERIAYPASFLIKPMLRIFYPIVWFINGIANYLLRVLGVSPEEQAKAALNRDELRAVLHDSKHMISHKHHNMLMSILDMETATVEDIMVPRNDIFGIDINEEWSVITEHLQTSQHTRVVVYESNIENIIGILHMRDVMRIQAGQELTLDLLKLAINEPLFSPAGTSLTQQLLNFQKEKKRIAILVDEYGDVQGLVTLEDILEEIVGEFTTDYFTMIKEVHPQEDGTFLVDCSANVRELNRAMHWKLPTDGPKTLNGLILEYLENIPDPGTSLLLHGYPIEVVQTSNNVVKTVKINPKARRITKAEKELDDLG